MMGDKIRGTIKLEKMIYYKDDFGIASCELKELEDGSVGRPLPTLITIKGTMPELSRTHEYHVIAHEIEDPKYGTQYQVECLGTAIHVDKEDEESKRRFLEVMFTEKQVEAMYDALSDPFTALYESDAAKLVQIKGCGAIRADEWIRRFRDEFSRYEFYKQLYDYNFSKSKIDAMIDYFESPALVVQIMRENPYRMVEVPGFGWKTVDAMVLDNGGSRDDPRRIAGFIMSWLDAMGHEGNSIVQSQDLMNAILEYCGESTPDMVITDGIHLIQDNLWWDEDKTLIGLKRYYDLELAIAKELLRIRDSEPLAYDADWMDSIHKLEIRQGWCFNTEQIRAIEQGVQNNLLVIHGLAGTGKSSTVSGILSVFPKKTIAQTALSGRAASRMSEITGKEGFTIHRLLGYSPMNVKTPGSKQGFTYHDENQLPYDIIILDEISMVDGQLFYNLLRAIPSGTKLIILGDSGQLESIGSCNIAHDMIASPEVPTVALTEIHRQARASAIITESIKVRQGKQIIQKEWAGTDIRGDLKDLKLICYSDASNTYYDIMQEYSRLYEQTHDVNQIEVIVPMKVRGDACTYKLNNAIQYLVNPPQKNKPSIPSFVAGQQCELRLGDKVINTQNNYRTMNTENKIQPIFNGQMGTVVAIEDGLPIVDFGKSVGLIVIPRDHLRAIELGYCITTHKSQGSQFDHVIVGIDFTAYALLSREMLYTAITRAKKTCTLVAQNNALRYATGNERISQKKTHLIQCLHEVAHPKLIF